MASFHREQRLLASLNHPGVAQVSDAGETADGLDYVVVEYIDGPSITRYAAEYELSWRDRVELIIRACEAVQHIHATGVLHRDIKPANILVSHDHGTPQPKVIDFGAATFAQADALLATQHPRFIGTIAYMAPEQLNSRDRADARCDVYSLGLILHELLSGGHPFQTDAIGLGELVRRIGGGSVAGVATHARP